MGIQADLNATAKAIDEESVAIGEAEARAAARQMLRLHIPVPESVGQLTEQVRGDVLEDLRMLGLVDDPYATYKHPFTKKMHGVRCPNWPRHKNWVASENQEQDQ